ncbi:uncharacterized protein LOC124917790 [Impatiens glandulifera]|uniref:uncharacterized protein LOC124917790 n=1 Tax=Impatiens glandulifera TaxID=253017 RepID=UPI001FB0E251|nr:uncharacterized protein LOC124917790 [Impatiens glandulifera]
MSKLRSRNRNLFAAGYSSSTFLIILCILVIRCYGSSSSASCGDIHNITFPFRLKGIGGSKECILDEYFSLSCENNQTYLSLETSGAGKYHVKSINYVNKTIHVSNVLIDKANDCSSLLLLYSENFDQSMYNYYLSNYGIRQVSVVFLRCEVPVKDRRDYIDISASCNSNNNNNNSYRSYALARIGRFPEFGEIENSCTVESIGYTSHPRLIQQLNITDIGDGSNIISYQEIHNALLFGFNVSWGIESCRGDIWVKRASCLGYYDPNNSIFSPYNDPSYCEDESTIGG